MKRLPWLWATVGVLGVYYFIRYMLSPYGMDDGNYYNVASVPQSFGVRTFDWHRLPLIFDVNWWSPRLSNMVVPLLMIIPTWVKGLIGAATQIGTLTLGAKIAGLTRRNSSLLCTLMAFLYVVALPWYEPMMVCAFFTNYGLTTLMLLALILMFVREKPTPWWATGLYTLFFAFWHEGYTAFSLCAFGLVLVAYRRMWRADRIAIVVALAAALVAFILMHGTQARFAASNYAVSRTEVILASLGIEIFLVLAAYCFISKKWRSRVFTPVLVALIGVAFAAYCQHWILRIAARSLHPGLACATFGIVYIIGRITPPGYFARPRWYATAAAVWIFLIAHFVAVIRCDAVLSRESKVIESEFLKHPHDDFFVPLECTRDVPIITLRHSYDSTWKPYSFTRITTACCHFEEDEMAKTGFIRVVPIELKDYREGMGEPINSNCKVYRYKGRFVALRSDIHPHDVEGEGNSEIHFSNCFTYGRVYRFTEFTGTDGRKYVWIYPMGAWLEAVCGPITELLLY